VTKLRRNILRTSAAAIALVLVLGFACLDGVDYRSYLQESYYSNTTARLRAIAGTNTPARGPLAAGFGRALLTPKINAPSDIPAEGIFRSLPLAGYGNRHGKPALGVHDDLYVKAVALRVGERLIVMVGADALIIPPEVTDKVRQCLSRELKLSREQLYLSATHTHSSLGGWGEGMVAEAFAGGFRPGVRGWFADRIVTAVRQAVADLQPAALGQGSFMAPEFVRNRLVGQSGRVDPEFSFLLVKQESGKSAVLGTYAAHATVLSGDCLELSADYPGAWQRAVEEATGGVAVFLAGSVGSHSPNPPAKGFAGVEAMGHALAQKLIAQLPQVTLTNSILFASFGLQVIVPPPNVRLTDGIRLRPWLARQLVPLRNSAFLQGLRLGDTLWFSTPCDFSGELALDIKDRLHRRGLNAVITSFNGDYIGYVIPLKYYHLDGYEPRTMSFFGPNVPDLFEDLIGQMALRMAGDF
jgi:hypothetical protein